MQIHREVDDLRFLKIFGGFWRFWSGSGGNRGKEEQSVGGVDDYSVLVCDVGVSAFFRCRGRNLEW